MDLVDNEKKKKKKKIHAKKIKVVKYEKPITEVKTKIKVKQIIN